MEEEMLDFALFFSFSLSSEVLVAEVSKNVVKVVSYYVLILMSSSVTEILQPAIRRLL